ncbi:MAG: DUF1329 domain-containing protein, partial [Gammaproteobacteria bacterium]|nr:DUF1329 domain-containing protein [Gammaproteobacteria bacterium]
APPKSPKLFRIPPVGYDQPFPGTEGIYFVDMIDMYNGPFDRYVWRLVGKRELYLPYNAYRLSDGRQSYEEQLGSEFFNPEHARYELHRVWVVDATLKAGARHLYKRRTFYVDEDSWQILVVDQYDNRDNLWRVSEGFAINYYNLPTLWTTLEVHTDLQAGRYLAFGLYNEASPYNFNVEVSEEDFTPSALRRAGRR